MNAALPTVSMFISIFVVLSRKKEVILSWLFLTSSMDLLSQNILGPTVSPLELIGLLVLPEALLFLINNSRKSIAIQLIIMDTILLTVWGIVFGFLFPWPDLTGVRPWFQQAQGRALVSLIRHTAYISLALYVAKCIRERPGILPLAIKAFFLGVAVNVVYGVVDSYAGGILTHTFFGRTPIEGRISGLNGEPRALGRVSALAILTGLIMATSERKTALFGTLLGSIGVAIAGSTSAFGALGAGLVTLAGHHLVRGRFFKALRILALSGIVVVSLMTLITVWQPGLVNNYVLPRVERVVNPIDRSLNEPIWVAGLEVFDRAAMNFLLANPGYMLLGTGPDLISIPASSYVSPIASVIYGSRIDSVPHMGLISTLANTGLIGVCFWGMAQFALWFNLVRRQGISDQAVAQLVLVVGIFSAVVMTPFFYLVLGVGIGRQLSGCPRLAQSKGKHFPLRAAANPSAGGVHE